jgi:hypothetical protein
MEPSIENLGLFGEPELVEVVVPEEHVGERKPKKKCCNRKTISNGKEGKCKEWFNKCPYHICGICKEQGRETQECPHKSEHDFDFVARMTPDIASSALFNLQLCSYIAIENLVHHAMGREELTGLAQIAIQHKDMHTENFKLMYEMYPKEVESYAGPVSTWALLTINDISHTVTLNKKNDSGGSV